MTKTKNLNLNKKNTANYVPLLSLDKARHSYFIHDHRVHSVESASTSVFKAAIHACIDPKRLANNNMLLESTSVLDGPDDLFSRWWLLCYAAKSLRLFASKEQAEHFLEESQRIDGTNSAFSKKISCN
jgi:hypothetical protein